MRKSETRVVSGLHRLQGRAPDTLLARVLGATGLAHRYTTRPGPIGPLYVAWSEQGVTAVEPAGNRAGFEAGYLARFGVRLVYDDALPGRLERGIERVVTTGNLGRLPVDLTALTPFQQSVLETTAAIPRGEMRPYWWIAKEMGRPGAARAVGSALKRNPVPVLIPCHRVGRSNGSIGEYALGADVKRELLVFEGLDPEEIEDAASRGVRLVGSDTTHIFCLPTCRNARRIAGDHRVEFESEARAAGSGYRPCRVCRPAAAA